MRIKCFSQNRYQSLNNNFCCTNCNSKDKKEYVEGINLDNYPSAIYQRINVNRYREQDLTEKKAKKIHDCLIGGALGDAFGRPVEILKNDQIKEYYGKDGIQDLATVGLKARITDDTQMTMYTADGLIKSMIKNPDSKEPDYEIIYKSYQDWYKTQTEEFCDTKRKGLLNEMPDLYSPVGPGKTCLGSLKLGIRGSIEKPINNSNKCGGIMRVAPVGLAYDDPEIAFKVGAECAAMTHGGPEAYLPAGFYAALISEIANGKDIDKAAIDSLNILSKYDNHEKTYNLLSKAMNLSQSDVPSDEAILSLGSGFYGDEAMAISLYSALKEPDNLKNALILAVNHSGDSDSTGSITGQIVALSKGIDTVPKEWIDSLEMSELLKNLAKDLASPIDIKNKESKYPLEYV
ncbi:MAG: ADP-ribosylglycohydrolase family protein [Cyanobacteria bacterium RUI128]|nr:ADP-ribosylglycohydrolase family protein [Cyanobacteria bacterium RUI128]